MAKKSQRIASRQAKLSGHKRKTHRRGPSGVPEVDMSSSQSLEDTPIDPDTGTPSPVPPRREAARVTSASAPTAVAHRYIKGELTQIGVLTVAVLVVLFVATFVLS